jgi:hypothetical protein
VGGYHRASLSLTRATSTTVAYFGSAGAAGAIIPAVETHQGVVLYVAGLTMERPTRGDPINYLPRIKARC